MKKPKNKLLSKYLGLLSKEVSKNKTYENSNNNVFNRRQFIEKTGMGFLGTAIIISTPSILNSCKKNEKDDVLDVAILGAGIAGLNCANHLLKSSLNFKIFEASKRAGGRILTHYNDAIGIGVFPEFGGDFVDSNHEDMLHLAKEFNLPLIDLEKEKEILGLEKDVYFFGGRKIEEKEVIQEFKKIATILADDIEAIGEDYSTKRAIELDNLPLSDYINSFQCSQWLKDLLIAAFTAEFGLDCKEQSSINLLSMIDTETSKGFKVFGESDERFRIKGGNSKIIEGLANKIGKERIIFNNEVSKISEDEKGIYTIHFSNSTTIKSKKIVCTIPFKILRNIDLDIKGITDAKRKSISELGYGMNTKLILAYEGEPWKNSKNNAMGYLFHPQITNGWDGSNNKTENNSKSAYVCYLGGEYSNQLNVKSFKNKMAPPWHIWKTELPENIVLEHVEKLNQVFLGSKQAFLNKHVFVNWIDYPFTKGSYSCYKVGQWTTIAGEEIKPINNFFFAGEHCSSDFQGYMNGGAETGRRVAEMVLEKIKSIK